MKADDRLRERYKRILKRKTIKIFGWEIWLIRREKDRVDRAIKER